MRPMLSRPLLRPLVFWLWAGALAVLSFDPALARDRAADRTAAYLDRIKTDGPALRQFLQAMPKGGDLHNHLAGAIYAESYIRWAAEDGLCIDLARTALTKAECDESESFVPAAQALADQALWNDLVDSLSMRNFAPDRTMRSGHDQFFATFFRMAVREERLGDMLANVARRAGAQNQNYLELMITLRMDALIALGAPVDVTDLAAAEAALDGDAMEKLIALGIKDLDAAHARKNELLSCNERPGATGCDVTIRVLYQVIRTLPPGATFAQFLYGFELAERDSRVVGLNLVAPEDDRIALDLYRTHMRMIDHLWQTRPGMNIALHAGEIDLGLVKPIHLGWHIEKAIEVGHAKRIGHGIDVFYDPDMAGLLELMRKRDILVEINLTSNDVILGISGDDHPWPLYRRSGIATALSTDDEGVSRIDLTHEFRRAVETYDLSYNDLKTLARNSLAYSFVPGARLFEDGEVREVCDRKKARSQACAEFLARSEKARLQMDLEQRFQAFEARFSGARD